MSTSALSPQLVELAHAHGVATEYWDWHGRYVTVGEETVVAVLAALGVSAGTPLEVEAALADHRDAPWRRTLPPVLVCREEETPWVPVHLPHGTPIDEMLLRLEDGGTRPVHQVDHWVDPRTVDGQKVGEATLAVPGDLPVGWHRLEVTIGGRTSGMPLVVTPARLEPPATVPAARSVGSAGPVRSAQEARGRRATTRPGEGGAEPAGRHTGQVWGLMTQLYAVRSEHSWGIGDLGDLGDLGAWGAGELGAGFVLVNPMHAAEPVPPMEPSPYLPTTRRFANPLYIRVEDVPEVAYLSAAERQLLEWHGDDARALNGSDVLDRDASWAAKRAALQLVFAQPRSPRRERAFTDFCEREGRGLVDFATWCALAEVHGLPWTDWPAELHDPNSEAVQRFREEHAHRVRFHSWLQWVVQEQLAAVHRALCDAGMPIGVVHDLAVGVHPRGADAWALGDALARGVTVGAPPDQYNQIGQDWSQPPWRPDQLAEQGYLPFRDMLRTVLRSAGGLRVDHIIGLFRLWWVPEGMGPDRGTYVRLDHEALVGILALEAHRAGAVVIGEDLGTVEAWVRDYLRERGILGTSILWFERDEDGEPLPAESYRELCLATVTTHDLPPSAGYLEGSHVDLRHRLGLLTRSLEEERAEDEAGRQQVLDLLRERGLLEEGAGVPEQIRALHRFLTWTPSLLLGVAVADLAGDKVAINQPGTSDEYPNWRLPLTGPDGRLVTLEDLMVSRWARRLAGTVATR
ncbi:MAG TPA: 4-alpha-glucanotransferase [Segeticoccus sp.]|uniref:4-alpha-glucanotransferase n=1 Tax=Segeticoccus sp. TaxID=2706531 RepID=UPI002D7F4759|nr:4-alpha-glucanotransferase [Segeticoccus sp.]HET8602092.1 4-alpha-glucanotransferase [Segeticoccus sp.]